MRSPNICGVILAAGSSSRMGRDKALLPLPGGSESFLSAALGSLLPATELVIVVAARNMEAIAPTVWVRSATLVENPTPEAGQFSSLRLGLREVLNRGRDAAFVALVDRLPASPATIALLRAEFLEAVEKRFWAVVPEHNGQHGHPIVLGREMIEAMLRAPAESNSREVLHANAARIRYVTVDDPNVVMNINTPEDYQQVAEPKVEK
jgi:CTP:molybdopterin cytidylyltransferase MocA